MPSPLRRDTRLLACLAMAALVAVAPAARGEDWSGHAITYSVTVRGVPDGMRWQASFKSWTMIGCKNWTHSTTLALNIQAARHKIVQRVDYAVEDSLDGPLAQSRYRASGDAAKPERRLKASFPAKDGVARIEIEGQEGGRSTALPEDIVRPRLAMARVIEESRKGTTRFTVAGLNPAVPAGWTRDTYEVLERWPYSDEPLPAHVTALLPGRSWYVKTSRADSTSGKSAYLEMHESGIVTRLVGEREGLTIEHTASKLEILPAAGC